jgi:hypothetical protein
VNTRFLLPAALALLAFAVGCGRPGAMYYEVPVVGSSAAAEDRNSFTLQDMRQAILSACIEKGWTAVDKDANTLEATITVRAKYTVVVTIPYKATDYGPIMYKDSTNMNYKPKDDGTYSINRSYNNWVNNLDAAIRSHIAQKK